MNDKADRRVLQAMDALRRLAQFQAAHLDAPERRDLREPLIKHLRGIGIPKDEAIRLTHEYANAQLEAQRKTFAILRAIQ